MGLLLSWPLLVKAPQLCCAALILLLFHKSAAGKSVEESMRGQRGPVVVLQAGWAWGLLSGGHVPFGWPGEHSFRAKSDIRDTSIPVLMNLLWMPYLYGIHPTKLSCVQAFTWQIYTPWKILIIPNILPRTSVLQHIQFSVHSHTSEAAVWDLWALLLLDSWLWKLHSTVGFSTHKLLFQHITLTVKEQQTTQILKTESSQNQSNVTLNTIYKTGVVP